MKIAQDIMDVLIHSKVEGNQLFLPPTQLERKLYVSVNKILEDLGGTWNRGKKCHIFPLHIDPSDILDEIIVSREWVDKKKEFQFFETPDELAEHLVELAEIKDYHKVLEPSAGKGRILKHLSAVSNSVYAVELEKNNFEYVRNNFQNVKIWNNDFLKICDEKDFPQEFDRVIMNPPFSKGQDVKHIFQAWDLLVKDGILVSIVSESPFFRENKLSVEFKKWIDENNVDVIDLGIGAFKSSNTMVKTRIIVARK